MAALATLEDFAVIPRSMEGAAEQTAEEHDGQEDCIQETCFRETGIVAQGHDPHRSLLSDSPRDDRTLTPSTVYPGVSSSCTPPAKLAALQTSDSFQQAQAVELQAKLQEVARQHESEQVMIDSPRHSETQTELPMEIASRSASAAALSGHAHGGLSVNMGAVVVGEYATLESQSRSSAGPAKPSLVRQRSLHETSALSRSPVNISFATVRAPASSGTSLYANMPLTSRSSLPCRKVMPLVASMGQFDSKTMPATTLKAGSLDRKLAQPSVVTRCEQQQQQPLSIVRRQSAEPHTRSSFALCRENTFPFRAGNPAPALQIATTSCHGESSCRQRKQSPSVETQQRLAVTSPINIMRSGSPLRTVKMSSAASIRQIPTVVVVQNSAAKAATAGNLTATALGLAGGLTRAPTQIGCLPTGVRNAGSKTWAPAVQNSVTPQTTMKAQARLPIQAVVASHSAKPPPKTPRDNPNVYTL